jgi:hypothetical protein
MRMLVTLAVILMFAGPLGAKPGAAETRAPDAKAAASTDISAQSRVKSTRPRILVQPRYPYRRYHSLYPLPYDIEYPGPYARRECAARYVQGYRPSGTVVVPRMNCWWVRG